MRIGQGVSIKSGIEVAEDFTFLGCEGMFVEQAEACEACVQKVEEGGRVVRGAGEDVAGGGYSC
jgi:hypothetical protein